jgi:5'-nucleotidase (lipoprotein e(P4) family)
MKSFIIVLLIVLLGILAVVYLNLDRKYTALANIIRTDTLRDKELVMGILYQQQAAEYRALCFQAYNLAKERVKDSGAATKTDDTLTVVTDLDETALDNSKDEAQLFINDTSYTPTQFNYWCNLQKSEAVPGSVAFFKFVADSILDKNKKHLQVFYVSNRDSAGTLAATRQNMGALSYPDTSAYHYLFETSGSSKEPRRQKIAATRHRIILLLGDNLIDVDKAFDGSLSSEQRRDAVTSMQGIWGGRYIILPNAIYGDWDKALYAAYQYKFGYPGLLTKEQQIRDSTLQGFETK